MLVDLLSPSTLCVFGMNIEIFNFKQYPPTPLFSVRRLCTLFSHYFPPNQSPYSFPLLNTLIPDSFISLLPHLPQSSTYIPTHGFTFHSTPCLTPLCLLITSTFLHLHHPSDSQHLTYILTCHLPDFGLHPSLFQFSAPLLQSEGFLPETPPVHSRLIY